MPSFEFDDRPLLDPAFDQLGYKRPADTLARFFARKACPAGFVSAITGEWGSGKTTFLNFVTKSDDLYSEDHGLPPLEVIKFEPWLISGHQDLIAAYFKHLADALGKTSEQAKAHLKTVTHVSGAGTKALVDAAANIAVLADGGLLAKPAALVVNKSLDRAVKALTKEPSLQHAFETLKTALSKSNRRFLVTIDDIDRLSRQEIRTVFQMVKSVGQLPNIIYVLSYDRRLITKALQGPKRGSRFLEKIIQYETALPKPLPGGVLAILDSHIQNLIADTPDGERWHTIVRRGIRRWMQRPRDAIRLGGSFNYIGTELNGEVDLQDVLALEGIRLFQPEVHDWIKTNEGILFGSAGVYLSDADKEATIDGLTSLLSADEMTDTLSLLCTLFPQLQKSMNNDIFGSTKVYYQAVRDGNVQSEAAYRSYFAFGLPEGKISRSILDSLTAKSVTIAHYEHTFEKFITENKSETAAAIHELTQAIYFRIEDEKDGVPEAILDGLEKHIKIIFEADDHSPLFGMPSENVRSTLKRTFTIWGPTKTYDYIINKIEEKADIDFLCMTIWLTARSIGKLPNDGHMEPLIKEKDFKSLSVLIISRLKAERDAGTLNGSTRIWAILQIWSEFGDAKDAKIWLSREIAVDKELLFKVGRTLVARTLGREPTEYTLRELPSNDHYDINAIITSSKKFLTNDTIGDDERRLFEELAVRGPELIALMAEKTANIETGIVEKP